jgi:excisionase family DNA binding protein
LSIYKPQDWPALLSTDQVAALLFIGRGAVIAMLERGELSGIRVGHPWRIAAEAVWPLVPSEIRDQWLPGPWRRHSPPSASLVLTDARQKPLEVVRLAEDTLDELRDAAAHLSATVDELLEQAIRSHLASLRQERELGGRFPPRPDR